MLVPMQLSRQVYLNRKRGSRWCLGVKAGQNRSSRQEPASNARLSSSASFPIGVRNAALRGVKCERKWHPTPLLGGERAVRPWGG